MKTNENSHRFMTKDGSEVILRTLREDELGNVKHLFMQIFKEEKYPLCTLVEMHQKYPSLLVGCFDKDQIVGTVFGWPDANILVVKAIAVIESYRKKGIGTALLKAFENASLEEGFESFVLGAEWKAVPFYLTYGLDCFANVQITPDMFPWDTIQELRSKYSIIGAVIFGPLISRSLTSKLNQELKVKVKTVKSDFESISIQIKPKTISKEALEEMKKDFNAYSAQFAFKKKLFQ